MAIKFDFPPLLAPGYHTFDLAGVERLCVRPFSPASNRKFLYQHLEQMVQDLLLKGIRCSLWVDGSFLTEKENPSDLDVIVVLDYDVTLSFTGEQKLFIEDIGEMRYHPHIDSFVITLIPRGHPEYLTGEADRADWARMYAVEHADYWLKGVAVIRLGENDVGLRINA